MNVCKTCGNNNMNKFCPDCGQKLLAERITIKSISKNAFHSIFNLEQGFFYTIKELILQPCELINNYLNGATKKYHNPIGLSIFLMTISVVVMALLIDGEAYVDSIVDQMRTMMTQMGVPFDEDVFRKTMKIMQNFYTVLPLIFIPGFALFAKLFFSSKKMNFAEHMLVFIYSSCIMALIGIFTNILYAIFPSLLEYMMIFSFPIWIFSLYYVIRSFYKQSHLKSIIYGTLIFILAYISFLLVSVLLGLFIGIGMVLLDKMF